jgi:hypothetical protein
MIMLTLNFTSRCTPKLGKGVVMRGSSAVTTGG